ncbi:MAG: hypothetical protein ACTSQE_17260 [Candidatus Heimdallarchaeaceae archaeon]
MQIKNERIKNISENEMESTVWRYLTFPKFISMLTYNALWFPKLKILQDEFEGTLPKKAYQTMQESHQKWKKTFSPELHNQIDNMTNNNIDSGKELIVVNCWFHDEKENEKMWKEYVITLEGVAVKSTIRKLATYTYVEPQFSSIGKVQYVDFTKHNQSTYLSNQAIERAFLKSDHLSHEKEVRIATHSIKTLACVAMDGNPYTQEQISGKNMNNFENPGLYIRINFEKLVESIIVAPGASEWFELLIKRIIDMSKLNHIKVERSALEN